MVSGEGLHTAVEVTSIRRQPDPEEGCGLHAPQNLYVWARREPIPVESMGAYLADAGHNPSNGSNAVMATSLLLLDDALAHGRVLRPPWVTMPFDGWRKIGTFRNGQGAPAPLGIGREFLIVWSPGYEPEPDAAIEQGYEVER